MNDATHESEVRQLMEDWARAVRDQNLAGVLAHRAADITMFDVPPPLECRGIDAYRDTWSLFYAEQPRPIAFEIRRMDVVAGKDVAFVVALMRCAEHGPDGARKDLDFRLTVGLRRVEGRWSVVHEHHSVPAG